MEKIKRLRQNKNLKFINCEPFNFDSNTHILRIVQALLGRKFVL